MREEKQQTFTDLGLPTGGDIDVVVHATPCYDFLTSLRALYNPRSYDRSRIWASRVRAVMGPELYSIGRFYFQGEDTAIGYGFFRVIPDLGAEAPPDDLLVAIRQRTPEEAALLMLDTGHLRRPAFESYEAFLSGGSHDIGPILHGLPPRWAARCRRVLTAPAEVQGEFASFLESYLRLVFKEKVAAVRDVVAAAAVEASRILELLPTHLAIERLTGGYTFAPELRLKRITIAPSVFSYPYLASRVDEATATALVVFGIRNDPIVGFQASPIELPLASTLKVLSSEHRLRILRKISGQPMMTAELVAALGLSQTTVHHHLAQLRSAGLVHQERTPDGFRHSARPEEIERIAEQLVNLLPALHPRD